MTRDTNGWSKAEMHVMESLDRLEEGQRVLQRDVGDVKASVAELKVKAGVWGGVSGLLAALGTLVVGIVLWLVNR